MRDRPSRRCCEFRFCRTNQLSFSCDSSISRCSGDATLLVRFHCALGQLTALAYCCACGCRRIYGHVVLHNYRVTLCAPASCFTFIKRLSVRVRYCSGNSWNSHIARTIGHAASRLCTCRACGDLVEASNQPGQEDPSNCPSVGPPCRHRFLRTRERKGAGRD